MADFVERFTVFYQTFNWIEGIVWIVIAAGIHWAVPVMNQRQRLWLGMASVGFVLFGISDFLEAGYRAGYPLWLWLWKIVVGTFLFVCRFGYLGWDRFRWNDRYVVFGVCLLVAALGAIGLQLSLSGE